MKITTGNRELNNELNAMYRRHGRPELTASGPATGCRSITPGLVIWGDSDNNANEWGRPGLVRMWIRAYRAVGIVAGNGEWYRDHRITEAAVRFMREAVVAIDEFYQNY